MLFCIWERSCVSASKSIGYLRMGPLLRNDINLHDVVDGVLHANYFFNSFQILTAKITGFVFNMLTSLTNRIYWLFSLNSLLNGCVFFVLLPYFSVKVSSRLNLFLAVSNLDCFVNHVGSPVNRPLHFTCHGVTLLRKLVNTI